MKKLSLCLLSLLIALNVFSATRKTGWEAEKIKGKVKERIWIEYAVKNKFGEDVKELIWKSTSRYDDKGNHVETTTYIGAGALFLKHIYKYDDKGNMVEGASYKADGTLNLRQVNKFDDKGNMIEKEAYNGSGVLFLKYTCKYDDNGNQIASEKYNANGSLSSKAIYNYDAKNNPIDSAEYNADGSLFSKAKYTCDDKGNMIEKVEYNPNGTLFKITTSSYTYYDDFEITGGGSSQKVTGENKNSSRVFSVSRITGREFAGLKGEVKENITIEYVVNNKSGEDVKEIKWKSIYGYDINGNKIEGASYKADGTLSHKYIYKKDITGDRIENAVNNAGVVFGKTVFKYDDKENRIEWNHYNADGTLTSKNINKYDGKGNKIEWESYKADGTLTSKNIIKYDDKGNRIEFESYKSDGTLSSKGIPRYDVYGKELGGVSYKSDGFLSSTYIYKYDDKGNKIEYATYKPDGALSLKSIYKYDDKGNRIEWAEYNASGSLLKFFTNSYTYYDNLKTPQGASTQKQPDNSIKPVMTEPTKKAQQEKVTPDSAHVTVIGQWEGDVSQLGAPSYRIVIVLTSEDEGTVEYPSLDAGGIIKLERKGNGSFVYRERITHGKLKVIDNGLMELKFQDVKTIAWSWRHEKYKEVGTAILMRKEPASQVNIAMAGEAAPLQNSGNVVVKSIPQPKFSIVAHIEKEDGVVCAKVNKGDVFTLVVDVSNTGSASARSGYFTLILPEDKSLKTFEERARELPAELAPGAKATLKFKLVMSASGGVPVCKLEVRESDPRFDASKDFTVPLASP